MGGKQMGGKQCERFPMINKFLSDQILILTGRLRTTKQVSSRIQQMRDRCPCRIREQSSIFWGSLADITSQNTPDRR